MLFFFCGRNRLPYQSSIYHVSFFSLPICTSTDACFVIGCWMNRFLKLVNTTLTCSYSKTVNRMYILPFQTAFYSLQKHGEGQCKFITNHICHHYLQYEPVMSWCSLTWMCEFFLLFVQKMSEVKCENYDCIKAMCIFIQLTVSYANLKLQKHTFLSIFVRFRTFYSHLLYGYILF